MDRDELVRGLRTRIADTRVLDAIAAIPRELFVPESHTYDAYEDAPLPIGGGQTISQPTVVARMCEVLELRPADRVLDIGTGSGYHAAVLSRLAEHVWGVERDPRLAERARCALRAARIENVTVLVGDGTRGLPDHAPFDAINVAATARESVPPALEEQLAAGGRLDVPVRRGRDERLVLVRRRPDGLSRRALEPVRFVPLRGTR
jgi:protein-L-isoaspartate(D-aspartate) O-methyltransferase